MISKNSAFKSDGLVFIRIHVERILYVRRFSPELLVSMYYTIFHI